jgi:type II secretory pathway component PulJ
MTRRAPTFSGFTLIEIVLAMAACAIILVAIFGVFSKAIHLRDNATIRTQAARVRAHAVDVIRNDLRNALVSGGLFAASLEGSQDNHGGGFPGYLKLTATTTVDDREEPAGDVQRVEYYIVEDPQASDRKAGSLVRTVENDLLATTVNEKPLEQPLLAGVTSMEVSFYDGKSWKDSWLYSTTETTLPSAVRVRLRTTDNPAPLEVLIPWTTQPAMAAATPTPAP